VVGFDRADQIHALRSAWLAWRGRREGNGGEAASASLASRQRNGLDGPWREAVLVALCLGGALLIGAVALRRSRQRNPVPVAYRRALRLLARRGLIRAPHVTARDFAGQVRAQLPRPAGDAFERLTEGYLAHRFGAREPLDPRAWRDLQQALRGLPRSSARGSAGL
jgi:hypothetical protein